MRKNVEKSKVHHDLLDWNFWKYDKW